MKRSYRSACSRFPIADLISLPFQYNANLDWGPEERTQTILNIQPVVPFALNDESQA